MHSRWESRGPVAVPFSCFIAWTLLSLFLKSSDLENRVQLFFRITFSHLVSSLHVIGHGFIFGGGEGAIERLWGGWFLLPILLMIDDFSFILSPNIWRRLYLMMFSHRGGSNDLTFPRYLIVVEIELIDNSNWVEFPRFYSLYRT